MTPELRNLPHIASLAFNEPLLLEPAYARVFICALAGQLGITRLTDTVSGVTLSGEQIVEPLALFGDDEEMGPRPSRSYQVIDGIAVLPVSGTLVSKTRSLQPYSGMTGYNGIIARLQQAVSDPGVDGILLIWIHLVAWYPVLLTALTLLPVCGISNRSGRWRTT